MVLRTEKREFGGIFPFVADSNLAFGTMDRFLTEAGAYVKSSSKLIGTFSPHDCLSGHIFCSNPLYFLRPPWVNYARRKPLRFSLIDLKKVCLIFSGFFRLSSCAILK
jgi:hypothetical protein